MHYAQDLARVLGRIEKALAHLIARAQLPFGMKTVGGRKCLDFFQVAEWRASTDHANVPTAVQATGPSEVTAERPAAAGGPEAA